MGARRPMAGGGPDLAADVSRSQSHIIAGSIVLGAAIVSVGLYAGLRASVAPAHVAVGPPEGPREPPRPLDEPPAAPGLLAAASTRGALPPAAPAAPSVADLRFKATQDVKEAMQADRWRYEERCWAPIARKHPGADPSTFEFNIAFDASGREIARGVSSTGPAVNLNDPEFAARSRDPTELARMEMHECLMQLHDLPLTIPPRGRNIDVTVPFQVP